MRMIDKYKDFNVFLYWHGRMSARNRKLKTMKTKMTLTNDCIQRAKKSKNPTLRKRAMDDLLCLDDFKSSHEGFSDEH